MFSNKKKMNKLTESEKAVLGHNISFTHQCNLRWNQKKNNSKQREYQRSTIIIHLWFQFHENIFLWSTASDEEILAHFVICWFCCAVEQYIFIHKTVAKFISLTLNKLSDELHSKENQK